MCLAIAYNVQCTIFLQRKHINQIYNTKVDFFVNQTLSARLFKKLELDILRVPFSNSETQWFRLYIRGYRVFPHTPIHSACLAKMTKANYFSAGIPKHLYVYLFVFSSDRPQYTNRLSRSQFAEEMLPGKPKRECPGCPLNTLIAQLGVARLVPPQQTQTI